MTNFAIQSKTRWWPPTGGRWGPWPPCPTWSNQNVTKFMKEVFWHLICNKFKILSALREIAKRNFYIIKIVPLFEPDSKKVTPGSKGDTCSGVYSFWAGHLKLCILIAWIKLSFFNFTIFLVGARFHVARRVRGHPVHKIQHFHKSSFLSLINVTIISWSNFQYLADLQIIFLRKTSKNISLDKSGYKTYAFWDSQITDLKSDDW